MSARLARSAFQNGVRRAQATIAPSVPRISRRMASTASHGAAKSDMPWVVGSLLVFGPAFLYLVSPSARKGGETGHHQLVHKDKKEYPALINDEHSKILDEKKQEKPEPELVKDDEGNEADVSEAVALSESSDSPNHAQSAEKQDSLKGAAQGQSEPEAPESGDDKASSSENDERSKKSGTFRDEGDSSPTDVGKAREATKENLPPKKAAESKD